MEGSLIVAPTADPRRFRTEAGEVISPPAGWECLPPGDAGLTRRVKAAGPTWTVIEKRGRKKFSQGVWAPAEHIAAARRELDHERGDPAHARRLAAAARRREAAQADYVAAFRAEVLAFLRFAPEHAALAGRLADAVAAHATPVGSGTVARTKRIAIEDRAEAAVLAWLRHQATGYDQMKVARVRGERRRVRQRLAAASRGLLEAHRGGRAHDDAGCALCRALPAEPPAQERA
jgi:hypothetical protein